MAKNYSHSPSLWFLLLRTRATYWTFNMHRHMNNRCCEGIKPNLNSKYKSDDYLEGLTKARLVVPYEVNSV